MDITGAPTPAEAVSRHDAPARPIAMEPTRCCLCGNHDGKPVGIGQDFEYHTSDQTFLAVRCPRCDLVYLDPRPTPAELGRIYPDDYHAFAFDGERFGIVHRARSWLEARRLLHPNGRTRRRPGRAGTSDRPAAASGGAAVPDHGQHGFARLPDRQRPTLGWYHFPRHWSLFNKQSIQLLAERGGLQIETLGTTPSPVNWTYSVRNLLVDWRAPRWIVEQFSLTTAPSLALFTIVDSAMTVAGRGALLRVIMRRVA